MNTRRSWKAERRALREWRRLHRSEREHLAELLYAPLRAERQLELDAIDTAPMVRRRSDGEDQRGERR